MDALDLARWQFGVTTVYHFLFVPITIGLSALVAGLQTAWVRTGDERWLRLTKFYGKLLLINFAMGVVTGIVQEFQFGMNWSDYSRFVGDIFGAPLAIEALLAFFLESTFLGLWIFGWDKLPKKVHLACIWAVAIGTQLSAYFILAANSWMQNPVGYRFNPDTGRAELTDFAAVLTNKVTLVTYPHTVAGCFLVAGALMLAIALWHLVRNGAEEFRPALRLGAWVTMVAALATLVTGDIQGKIMTDVQPMKMAAAEGLYETERSAGLSVFTIGSLDGSREVYALKIPGLLSWLGQGDVNAAVEGVNDLQARYSAQYGAGSYTPIIPVTYWSFRLMIGFGLLTALVAAWALWTHRKGRRPTSRWLVRAGIVLPLLPLAANAFGWIFTEMGRQPWIVFGEMLTRDGVSRTVSASEVVTSLAGFTLLYGLLAVVEVKLLLRFIRPGLPDPAPPPETDTDDRPLAFAY
ncbi:cytochrome ubiquinol oxidase subunit I [Phytohabitans aurantiacus]|uniref:cytochrome ubiquinol oxidase subunit I n=1 Tax=Phytohabitans aurantiacus TaxID=3016789 RepID=UPI0024931A5A|nr:cytochrome ubiquinol oxidase subunit I [Phytohabitans aurantiacus]